MLPHTFTPSYAPDRGLNIELSLAYLVSIICINYVYVISKFMFDIMWHVRSVRAAFLLPFYSRTLWSMGRDAINGHVA